MSAAPMCRAAPKRHQLAKVPACAARHIGAALLDNHPPPAHHRHLRQALLRLRYAMPG